MSSERVLAEVFPPGDTLKEELEARGWSQTDLAEIIGRPVHVVNEIINAKRAITPETAQGLAGALGTTAQFWLNKETRWQLSKLGKEDDAVSRRADLYTVAPIKEMVRRGWIEDSSNVGVLEHQVMQFFDITSLGDQPAFVPNAYRKSTSYLSETPSQTAWLFRAKKLASTLSAGSFSESKFSEALEQLQALLASPEEVRHVPRILAQAGVRFIVVEHLSGTRIDGACFWLDNNAPVIAMSLRYDRIDWFWFTLMHECDHVRRKDTMPRRPVYLDVDLVGENVGSNGDKPENERLADQFAAEFLIPRERLLDFINRSSPLYYRPKINGFAKTLQIHPGIVVGQLQHEGEIGYNTNRNLLVPIRQYIIGSALTDGWGNTVAVAL